MAIELTGNLAECLEGGEACIRHRAFIRERRFKTDVEISRGPAFIREWALIRSFTVNDNDIHCQWYKLHLSKQ